MTAYIPVAALHPFRCTCTLNLIFPKPQLLSVANIPNHLLTVDGMISLICQDLNITAGDGVHDAIVQNIHRFSSQLQL
jgi:hypothetical protein